MRRLLLLTLALSACAHPMPQAVLAPDGVRTTDDPNGIYFFRTYRGSVEECPDCILAEYPDKDERIAYYVEPESKCSLRKGDATGVRSGVFKEKYSVMIELSESGKKSLSRCAALKVSREHFTPSFLVFVGDKLVRTEFVDPHSVEIGLLSFFGSYDLERIAEILRPDEIPNLEL